jgi:ABC-type dipeptide/oligopeptide/nickel transport system ATPase subunit
MNSFGEKEHYPVGDASQPMYADMYAYLPASNLTNSYQHATHHMLTTACPASVQEALNSLTLTRTTLVIAHRLSTIRKADQIIVLDKGRILEVGSFDKLMETQGAFHAMWLAQLEDAKELEGVSVSE